MLKNNSKLVTLEGANYTRKTPQTNYICRAYRKARRESSKECPHMSREQLVCNGVGTQETNKLQESIQARRRTKVFAKVDVVFQTSMQKRHQFQRKLDHPALYREKKKSKRWNTCTNECTSTQIIRKIGTKQEGRRMMVKGLNQLCSKWKSISRNMTKQQVQ